MIFRSIEWKTLKLRDREKMKVIFSEEGDFWMTRADFCQYFTNIDTCHFFNTSLIALNPSSLILKKCWCESVLVGAWTHAAKDTPLDRSGGDISHDTHLDNPQV